MKEGIPMLWVAKRKRWFKDKKSNSADRAGELIK